MKPRSRWTFLPTLVALIFAGQVLAPAQAGAELPYEDPPENNWEWAEHYRSGWMNGMPDLYYDGQFKAVFNAIVPVGKGKFCQTAVEDMLPQLNRLRKDHPELFEGMSYGPVTIESSSNKGHFGVVFYPTPGPGQTWEDTIDQGVVIEQTNFISDWTGHYLARPYPAWENPKIAGFTVGEGKPFSPFANPEDAKFYWDEDETYPDPDCDPKTEHCPGEDDEGGGGGGGSPLEPQDDHPAASAERRVPVAARASRDPNEKTGPLGVGAARYVTGRSPLTYVVSFENVGGAPAQVVTIEDRLDDVGLDLATFELGAISFGDTRVNVPLGSTAHEVLLDLRPERSVLVRVRAELDAPAAVVRWTFESIDPATFELPAFDGFLPPNAVPPEGQGSVSYSVAPRSGLASGTAIGAGRTASIVFDENDPIETGDWLNTIDGVPPSSNVQTLGPLQATSRFEVTWTGSDPSSSGVSTYSVWIAENGGAFVPWLLGREETSAFLTGLAGRTYSFYSVARDRVGNEEAPPAAADATTTVAVLDHFAAYQAGEADRAADKLPRDCNLTLDVPLFGEVENFTASRAVRFLVPADEDGGGLADGVTHVLGYQIKASRQGVAAPSGRCSRQAANPRATCTADADCQGGVCEGEKFTPAAKHRRWSAILVENGLGTVFLDTVKEKYLLAPTPKGLGAPPDPALGPSAVDHYTCYSVKQTRGYPSGQAPGGKFRKDLQLVVADQFEDGRIRRCSAAAPRRPGEPCTGERSCGGTEGVTSFCQSELHPTLAGGKLYDLKKPLLFCTPAAERNVDIVETDADGDVRTTSCTVPPASVGSPTSSLVCYAARTATKVLDPLVAARLGVALGTAIEPRQGVHEPRSPFVLTELPNPRRIATKKEAEICVPSQTLWVRPGFY